jgi:pathogenesis-related protein 1
MIGSRKVATLGLLLMAGCTGQAEKPAEIRASSKRIPEPQPHATTRMAAGDIQSISAYHNKVRAGVGVGPLEWSASLAGYAQQWADHLAATTCKMAHRTQRRYGENLFQGTAGHYTAVDAAKAWETEKKDYAGGVLTESNWHPAGHYTQMVWRGTTAFGCGEVLCAKTLLVACNYDPPGNYIGQRPY